MKCFLDMDGIIVDLVGGVCKFYRVKNPYDKPEMHGDWDFSRKLGIKNLWKPLGKDFWLNLEMTPDAQKILNLVEKRFQNISLLTAPCDNDECIPGKLAWVRKYLPKYISRIHVTTEKEGCAHGNSILIDDFDHNIDNFITFGGIGILVPRLWNSLHKWNDCSFEHLEKVLQHEKSSLPR